MKRKCNRSIEYIQESRVTDYGREPQPGTVIGLYRAGFVNMFPLRLG